MNERTGTVADRLARLGLQLPLPPAPVARACAVNVLARLQAATGSLDAVTRLVKLTVFVACTGDLVQRPQVADGVSQLLLDVLGAAPAATETGALA